MSDEGTGLHIADLREIARRWVKGFVVASEVAVAFDKEGLSEREINLIEKEVWRIAERITRNSAATDVGSLLDEYTAVTSQL